MTRQPHGLGAVLVLVVSALAFGCGARRDGQSMAGSDSSSANGSAAASAADVRPADLGPPVGHDDSLLNAIAPQLAPWVAIWSQAMPGFAVDSLHRGGSARAFRDGQIQPLSTIDSQIAAPAHRVFFVDAPERRYTLVIDQYQGLEEEKGVLVVSGGVDSAPLLLDRGLGVANRFAFCGTGCRFEWGAWIDSTTFALAGSGTWGVAGHEEPGGYVDVYSIVDSTRTRFWTRPVSDAERRSYGAAWGQWLRDRYHELKESRGRS